MNKLGPDHGRKKGELSERMELSYYYFFFVFVFVLFFVFTNNRLSVFATSES